MKKETIQLEASDLETRSELAINYFTSEDTPMFERIMSISFHDRDDFFSNRTVEILEADGSVTSATVKSGLVKEFDNSSRKGFLVMLKIGKPLDHLDERFSKKHGEEPTRYRLMGDSHHLHQEIKVNLETEIEGLDQD
ncbi:MAG: hypothetical protein K8F91_00370 [Candidatus Obscuribacterales bacterium]|nr:hypothetical protein [Candidatus Obscuribacterales bacterium]